MSTSSEVVPTVTVFRAWLRRAQPGEAALYHRGYLARDTSFFGRHLTYVERRKIAALADAARQAAAQGQVHLVQRRHGPGDFSYLAIARHRPIRSVAASSPENLEIV